MGPPSVFTKNIHVKNSTAEGTFYTQIKHTHTWVKLQRLGHHVPYDGLRVGGFGDSHGFPQSPPQQGVPDQPLVPACCMLQ